MFMVPCESRITARAVPRDPASRFRSNRSPDDTGRFILCCGIQGSQVSLLVYILKLCVRKGNTVLSKIRPEKTSNL